MYFDLVKDEEFGSLNLLKVKYRKADQIIQRFYKLGSSQKFGYSFLIDRTFERLWKILLNHVELIEFLWMTKNLCH